MFVIATEKGYFKDYTYDRCEYTPDLNKAKKYSTDFWAWRAIKMMWIRGAKVVEIDDK